MDGPMNIEVLQATILEIRKFEKYETNWDGRGSIKPNFNSIDSAIYFVTKLFSYFAEKNIKWNSPHVSADEDGVITFEWWAPYINATSNDKLTLYFEQDRIFSLHSYRNEDGFHCDEDNLVMGNSCLNFVSSILKFMRT